MTLEVTDDGWDDKASWMVEGVELHSDHKVRR